MPKNDTDQDFEKKFLTFTETSVKRVEELEKRAADAEARVAELEQDLEVEKSEKSDLEKQASYSSFDPERVRELSDLLCASGFVKASSEEVQDSFNTDPNAVLGVFSEMIQSGADGSELTSIKSSSEHKPNLWQQAAVQK
jgi:hypothetical protein